MAAAPSHATVIVRHRDWLYQRRVAITGTGQGSVTLVRRRGFSPIRRRAWLFNRCPSPRAPSLCPYAVPWNLSHRHVRRRWQDLDHYASYAYTGGPFFFGGD